MNAPLVWVGCGEQADTRIEAYSPAAGSPYGSLDASLYACQQHTGNAAQAVRAARMTPYPCRATVLHPRPCGFVYRYPTAKDGAQ